MISYLERKKAFEVILSKRLDLLKQLNAQRDILATEIVQLQCKIDLLKELEHESSEKLPETKEENKEVSDK